MRGRAVLAAVLLSVPLLVAAVRPSGYSGGYGSGYTGQPGYAVSGSVAVVDTDTVTWWYTTQWDTTTVPDGSAHPGVPDDRDSTFQDAGGDLFAYGYNRKDQPTTVQSVGAARMTTTFRDGAFPDPTDADARALFMAWDLSTLPAGRQITEARLFFEVINGGGSDFNNQQMMVAVMDTAGNYADYVSGTANATDPSYFEPTWDYSVLSTTTPWSLDLDNGDADDRYFSDFGQARVIMPPYTAQTTNLWEADITSLVRKHHADGGGVMMLWFFVEGLGGSNFYINSSFASTEGAYQPTLTVSHANKGGLEGADFVVITDFHSNRDAFAKMGNTIDPAEFDFILHTGDRNFEAVCDSLNLRAAADSLFGSGFPLGVLEGNHEVNATGCGDALITESVPTDNMAFIQEMGAFGGKVAMMGPSGDSQDKRYRSYSFDVGNVHIVMLGLESQFQTGTRFTTTDSLWLDRDLGANSLPKVLVFSHKNVSPDFTWPDIDNGTEFDGAATDTTINSANLIEILNRHAVDAYIHGHTHKSWHEQVNGVWHIANPSTHDNTQQGFMTVSISDSGGITVRKYRGYQADESWELVHTFAINNPN